jgi:hypothetical protein
VVVPPDIINEDTSGDVMVPEGGTVKLTCRARGYPVPHVLWRREDNIDLVIKEPTGVKTKGEFKIVPCISIYCHRKLSYIYLIKQNCSVYCSVPYICSVLYILFSSCQLSFLGYPD